MLPHQKQHLSDQGRRTIPLIPLQTKPLPFPFPLNYFINHVHIIIIQILHCLQHASSHVLSQLYMYSMSLLSPHPQSPLFLTNTGVWSRRLALVFVYHTKQHLSYPTPSFSLTSPHWIALDAECTKNNNPLLCSFSSEQHAFFFSFFDLIHVVQPSPFDPFTHPQCRSYTTYRPSSPDINPTTIFNLTHPLLSISPIYSHSFALFPFSPPLFYTSTPPLFFFCFFSPYSCKVMIFISTTPGKQN